MLTNYFKIAFRNFIRNKSYSFINIFGLAIGMASAILIMLWIQDELSYDRYHKNADQIYQAYLKGTQGNDISYQSTTSPYINPVLQREFPEVQHTVRVKGLGEVVVKYEDKMLVESEGIAAEASLFDIFTYPFIKGYPEIALSKPHSVVLTQSMANRYFADVDPIGKILRVNNQYDFEVTGVIADVPNNSYRKFDYIVPFQFLKEIGLDINGSPFFPCQYFSYVMLHPDANIKELNSKLKNYFYSEGKEITFEIELIPFAEAYIKDTGGNAKLYIFGIIGVIILAIASINFMNLSTAQSIKRTKEIGVRKVVGAGRRQLINQFLGESILITFISATVAIAIADLSLTTFNTYIEKQIVINYFNPNFILGIVGIVLLTGILAGTYPALFLSAFSPINIFRGKSQGNKKLNFRKSLIVVQFVLSTSFIITTLIISKQINYINNIDYGMNKNNLLYVKLDGDIRNKYEIVKNELLRHPNISYVSSSSELPNSIRSGSFFQWGLNDNHARRICQTYVDYDFLKTFDIQLAAGRFYSKEFSTDQQEAIIVNESAMNKVGLTFSETKEFYFGDRFYKLIGVVKDFQHNSPLNQRPSPIAIRLQPTGNQFLIFKINEDIKDIHQIHETVTYAKTVCDKFSPERPLQYNFLSEFSFHREKVIESVKMLITYSTVLAILISCLGLFGLSSCLNEQRTKEIGIRKTLGASVFNIIIMLIKNVFSMVILAIIIAWPISYFVMNSWLTNFAYKAPLSWWTFVLAGIITLLIAVITISYQAIRSALANPIKSLRYE